MSVYAVSLLSIDRDKPFAAQGIFTLRNNLNVGRVHAVTATAKMVTLLFTIGNMFNEKLIDNSVGSLGFKLCTSAKIGIATVSDSPDPIPARHAIMKMDCTDAYLPKDSREQPTVDRQTPRDWIWCNIPH